MIEGKHSQWLNARGIPSDLAARLGLTAHSKGEAQWLSIPYRLDGQIVNRKHGWQAKPYPKPDFAARLLDEHGTPVSELGANHRGRSTLSAA